MGGRQRVVYPIPAAWLGPVGWPIVLGGVIFGSFAVFTLTNGVISGLSGAWSRAAFLILTAIAVGTFIPMITTQNANRTRTEIQNAIITHTAGQTVIYTDRRRAWADVVSAIAIAVGGYIFCDGIWGGTLDLPLTHSQRLSFPPQLAIIAMLSAYQLLLYANRKSTGDLTLTPTAIINVEWIGRTMLLWNEVESVETKDRNRKSSYRCTVLLRMRTGSRLPKQISVDKLSVGAPAAYWMLKYYAEHPEARCELGDGRATRRLMTGIGTDYDSKGDGSQLGPPAGESWWL